MIVIAISIPLTPAGAILPPNTVAEVAFAAALTRASMESERFHYSMKIVYAPFGDSFAASKAGRCYIFRHPYSRPPIDLFTLYLDHFTTSALILYLR